MLPAVTLSLALSVSPMPPVAGHVVRVESATVALPDGGTALVGRGRWYSAEGDARVEEAWARLQVDRAECRTQLAVARSQPLVPPGGVSHGALAAFGLVALAAGVVSGALAARWWR